MCRNITRITPCIYVHVQFPASVEQRILVNVVELKRHGHQEQKSHGVSREQGSQGRSQCGAGQFS